MIFELFGKNNIQPFQAGEEEPWKWPKCRSMARSATLVSSGAAGEGGGRGVKRGAVSPPHFFYSLRSYKIWFLGVWNPLN